MSTIASASLTDLENTGFPQCTILMNEGTGAEYSQRTYPKIAAIATIIGSLLFFAQQIYHPFSNQDEITITSTQLSQNYTDNISTIESGEIQTAYEQIVNIKKSMGFNILELAAVLQVSRPTIYDWLESKASKIRKNNQIRLNHFSEISKNWDYKHSGQFGSHLHKPIGNSNVSLFDLLKSNNLDLNKINSYMDSIARAISKKQQADKAHEALLRKHNFEPISKEDMEDRLNDIDFSD